MPTVQDLRLVARLIVYALVAGIVPQQGWRGAMRLLSRLWGAKHRRKVVERAAQTVDSFEQALECSDPALREKRVEDVLYARQEDTLSILKEYWPGGWNPTLRVQGAAHIAAALNAGKGVILWVALQNNRVAWKMALHRAGVRVAHLSRVEHGFSETDFGMRYLNPICTNVESRYVERIVIDRGGEVSAIRRVRERLARNEVVSIQDSGGGKTLGVPFLTGYRPFNIGAPSIAVSSGATLLPLFVMREDGNAFLVDIGPAIEAAPGISRAQAVETMTREFARQLGEHVRVHPECWNWARWSPSSTTAAVSGLAESGGADAV